MSNSSISLDSLNPDIVTIGGGPIGLWTAIQTKILTKKDILIIEKYKEYKRADIRLNINPSSLTGIPNYEPLKNLIQKWGDKPVPIKEIEDSLTNIAHDLGIKIIKGKTVDPKQLQEIFPNAKVFIGADGARSTVRKELFGDQYAFNTPLQYLIQSRYIIKTPEVTHKQKSFFSKFHHIIENYTKQKFAGHFITQSIRPKENGQSEVTLRIFVNKKTYDKMADATFSKPYCFETDLDKIPNELRSILVRWWGTQKQDMIVPENNKLTVIPLASYAAKKVVKIEQKKGSPTDQVVTVLVGDAAQAYPFFRAINNGFLLGTNLAKCVDKAFKTLEQKNSTKKFASSFISYSKYAKIRSYIERIRAYVKNLFINVIRFWLRVSDRLQSPIRLSNAHRKKCYNKGNDIWVKLEELFKKTLHNTRLATV